MIDSITKQSAAVETMAKHWPLIKVLMGGTSEIRAAGKDYLPQWPNEEDKSYNNRLKTATLYPAFKRTVEVLASKPFSKAAKLSDDVPKQMVEWLEDADLQGRDIQAFSSEIFQECVSHGLSYVYVDFPRAEGIRTRAQEITAGVRPYFVHYSPWNVLGWRSERINGVEKLTQVRLKETKLRPVGEFEDELVEQIRVLTPGAWQLWEKDKHSKWFMIDEGVTTLTEIPLVAFYGERTGFMTGTPPLLELAHQNIEHYQSSSDQQTILHVARVPILTIIGADDDAALTVGASAAVKLPVNADMKFVEHSGQAIEAGRQSLLDLEERMKASGSEMLTIKIRGPITATQADIENEGNKCALQKIVENFEDAMDQALQYMADWVNEMDGGGITLYKAFGEMASDASWDSVLKALAMGLISQETALVEGKRRGILSDSVDWESEQDKISSQLPPLGTLTDNVI
jgi:hypothetical protein